MATTNSSATPSTMDETKASGDFKEGAVTTQNDVENAPEIDTAAEAALVRKLDIWIIPPVMMLYLLSFLDRTLSFVKWILLLTPR